jgi:hypothetical protein
MAVFRGARSLPRPEGVKLAAAVFGKFVKSWFILVNSGYE